MALGFLFMGGGSLTFGTSPEAVAALVIALFPALPASTMDNRCHLQVRGAGIGQPRPVALKVNQGCSGVLT
jgi:hypothetical protein